MQIFHLNITSLQVGLEFDIVVGTVFVVVAFIDDELPIIAVGRGIDAILIIDVVCAVVLDALVVVEVELDSLNGLYGAQIHHHPFAGLACACRPICTHTLVGEIRRHESAVGARRGDFFAKRKEHPTGETVDRVLDVAIGVPVRIVAESGTAIHYAVVIECRRIKTDAALKLVFKREHTGRHMPIVAFKVAEGAAVAATLHESAGFVAHRVMTLVGERTERRIAYVDAIGVYLKFRARSTVLEVVFAVIFGHRSAFGKRSERHFVVVVHSEAFPAVFFRMKHHHIVNFAYRVETIAAQLNRLERIFVARTVVEIQAAVVVEEEIRVPPGQNAAIHHLFEFTRLRLVGIPHGEPVIGRACIEKRVATHESSRRALVVIIR